MVCGAQSPANKRSYGCRHKRSFVTSQNTAALRSKDGDMDITERLKALETELLTNTTRKNAGRVSFLLADTFREYGSSGQIYSKSEIISTLQEEAPVSISLSDFAAVLLSENVALVTYRSHKHHPDRPSSLALRSSIWLQTGGEWKMFFHQGTKLDK